MLTSNGKPSPSALNHHGIFQLNTLDARPISKPKHLSINELNVFLLHIVQEDTLFIRGRDHRDPNSFVRVRVLHPVNVHIILINQV